jgi:hypothetical protein
MVRLAARLIATLSIAGLAVVSPVLADTLVYNTVNPCRVIDTRLTATPFLEIGTNATVPEATDRDFNVNGGTDYSAQGGNAAGCGIPSDAVAAAINIIAADAEGIGNMAAWAAGDTPQLAAVVTFGQARVGAPSATQNISNMLIVPLCTASCPNSGVDDITFRSRINRSKLVVDVVGYFTSSGSEGGGGGTITFSKDDIYQGAGPDANDEAPVSGTNNGNVTVTATCADANDIAIEGTCWVVSPGETAVVLTGHQANNWDTTSSTATYECTFRNESASTAYNVHARILCIGVAGP